MIAASSLILPRMLTSVDIFLSLVVYVSSTLPLIFLLVSVFQMSETFLRGTVIFGFWSFLRRELGAKNLVGSIENLRELSTPSFT